MCKDEYDIVEEFSGDNCKWDDEEERAALHSIGVLMLWSVLTGAVVGAVITATIAALWLW